MSDHASLCFLSYNRPGFIFEAIESAKKTAEYPIEVIVHDDGSELGVQRQLAEMTSRGEISRLILEPTRHNEGVGTAFNRCAAVSTGDPIIKIDQDLLFHQGWLRRTVEILQDLDVGCVGLFKYHVDPVDWRKMNHRNAGGHDYVDDFVGSAIAIPRAVWDEYGPWPEHSDAFAEDVDFKKLLQSKGLELALPVEDLAQNRGFGLGLSTVAVMRDGRLTASEIHHEPLVLS